LGAGAFLGAAPAAAAAAADIAASLCAACHGEGGNSVVPTFPKLAGQQTDYLAKQLTEFLSGKRKSEVMAPAIASLKSGDVPGLAAYYAAQKPVPGKVEDPALAAAGKKLYDDGNEANGVPACGGCHLEKGEGNERFPRVAGQHQAYAVQQMMDFKTGARNNDKGRVMRVVAERMTEAEMKAVAEYLAAL
jgi:cytochrome c553